MATTPNNRLTQYFAEEAGRRASEPTPVPPCGLTAPPPPRASTSTPPRGPAYPFAGQAQGLGLSFWIVVAGFGIALFACAGLGGRK